MLWSSSEASQIVSVEMVAGNLILTQFRSIQDVRDWAIWLAPHSGL